MNTADVTAYLSSLSDSELVDACQIAEMDAMEATYFLSDDRTQVDFTSFLLYKMELQRRGIHIEWTRGSYGQQMH